MISSPSAQSSRPLLLIMRYNVMGSMYVCVCVYMCVWMCACVKVCVRAHVLLWCLCVCSKVVV